MRRIKNYRKSLYPLKNKNGNYILFYKKKFHWDESTIVEYLAAVMNRQYLKENLYIFNPYHQAAAKDVIWKNGISYSIEEDELEKDL